MKFACGEMSLVAVLLSIEVAAEKVMFSSAGTVALYSSYVMSCGMETRSSGSMTSIFATPPREGRTVISTETGPSEPCGGSILIERKPATCIPEIVSFSTISYLLPSCVGKSMRYVRFFSVWSMTLVSYSTYCVSLYSSSPDSIPLVLYFVWVYTHKGSVESTERTALVDTVTV